jgi:DNA topoisomerase-1
MSTSPTPPAEVDARRAARDAGLRYSTDSRPGIARRRRGHGFEYVDRDGATIRDPDALGRVRALAVPPAWTDVWICPDARGHLQATGRDARGRKQYRYHAAWRSIRDETKFERLALFGRRLPRIRRRVDRDLGRRGLPEERVLALVVALLERTLVRVGNEEYARENRSFGLTTLRDRHARIDASKVRFRFRSKHGKLVDVGLRDRRLARLVRRCQELPGQELFAYLDEDGEARTIDSDAVNRYIAAAGGGPFTAKDFRTWAGTVLAFRALCAAAPAAGIADGRRQVADAVRIVAGQLGNTPAVCRKSYIHPAVVDAYLEGTIGRAMLVAAEEAGEPPPPSDDAEAAAIIRLLARQARRERRRAREKAAA